MLLKVSHRTCKPCFCKSGRGSGKSPGKPGRFHRKTTSCVPVVGRLYFGLLIEYNGEDRIAWKDTDMAGETCLCGDYRHSENPGGICGKVHGMMPSVVNMWHRCTGCGRIYCDDCGKNCLPGKRFMDRTRTCPECGSRTQLF